METEHSSTYFDIFTYSTALIQPLPQSSDLNFTLPMAACYLLLAFLGLGSNDGSLHGKSRTVFAAIKELSAIYGTL